MNYKKKVLVLNLNEINLNFILKNAKKYKNQNPDLKWQETKASVIKIIKL